MGEAGESERGLLERAAFPLERYRFEEHPAPGLPPDFPRISGRPDKASRTWA